MRAPTGTSTPSSTLAACWAAFLSPTQICSIATAEAYVEQATTAQSTADLRPASTLQEAETLLAHGLNARKHQEISAQTHAVLQACLAQLTQKDEIDKALDLVANPYLRQMLESQREAMAAEEKALEEAAATPVATPAVADATPAAADTPPVAAASATTPAAEASATTPAAEAAASATTPAASATTPAAEAAASATTPAANAKPTAPDAGAKAVDAPPSPAASA